METLQGFVEQFTYLGIFAVLLLGSLGVPIPEEMAIIAAAVLSHEGLARWWLALPVCLLGVLSGDMVLSREGTARRGTDRGTFAATVGASRGESPSRYAHARSRKCM